MPVVKTRRQEQRDLWNATMDLKPGDVVSLSPKYMVWRDDEYTGIQLDAFREENRQVEIPEVDDPSDLDIVRKAIVAGVLVRGPAKEKITLVNVDDGARLRVLLDYQPDTFATELEGLQPVEIEALLFRELNTRRRQEYIDILNKAVAKYAVQHAIVNKTTNETVYEHELPLKEDGSGYEGETADEELTDLLGSPPPIS